MAIILSEIAFLKYILSYSYGIVSAYRYKNYFG